MVIHTESGENPAVKNGMTIRQNIAFLFRTIVPLFVMKISFVIMTWDWMGPKLQAALIMAEYQIIQSDLKM